MSLSGRQRHRDRKPGRRSWDDAASPPEHRVFRLTDEQRQAIADHLRDIDDARLAIEKRHDAANREVIRALRLSADAIFDLLNDLEETGA
jgi:DNA-binding PadR family transcriptional regulator